MNENAGNKDNTKRWKSVRMMGTESAENKLQLFYNSAGRLCQLFCGECLVFFSDCCLWASIFFQLEKLITVGKTYHITLQLPMMYSTLRARRC